MHHPSHIEYPLNSEHFFLERTQCFIMTQSLYLLYSSIEHCFRCLPFLEKALG